MNKLNGILLCSKSWWIKFECRKLWIKVKPKRQTKLEEWKNMDIRNMQKCVSFFFCFFLFGIIIFKSLDYAIDFIVIQMMTVMVFLMSVYIHFFLSLLVTAITFAFMKTHFKTNNWIVNKRKLFFLVNLRA